MGEGASTAAVIVMRGFTSHRLPPHIATQMYTRASIFDITRAPHFIQLGCIH